MENGVVSNRDAVLDNWHKTSFLAKQKKESRGWTIEVLKVLDLLPDSFTLNDVYKYEIFLAEKFPNNNFVKDKIRQQLQVLRDKGLLEFSGRGIYRKT